MLPLVLDGGGGYAIRPDGEIVRFLWDSLNHCEIEQDIRTRNMVLYQGSRKYPELQEIVPSRSPDDMDCPYCGGTGIELLSVKLRVDNIVCYCGGIG